MMLVTPSTEDDYENPEIGLGLALDIDRWRPREQDRSEEDGAILDRWRLEDALRDLFGPGRKYYNKKKLLLVLKELLNQWEVKLHKVLQQDRHDLLRFSYGIRNYRWCIRFQSIGSNSEVVRITETRCEREIPHEIRFRTRKGRTKPEYLQAQLLEIPNL